MLNKNLSSLKYKAYGIEKLLLMCGNKGFNETRDICKD